MEITAVERMNRLKRTKVGRIGLLAIFGLMILIYQKVNQVVMMSPVVSGQGYIASTLAIVASILSVSLINGVLNKIDRIAAYAIGMVICYNLSTFISKQFTINNIYVMSILGIVFTLAFLRMLAPKKISRDAIAIEEIQRVANINPQKAGYMFEDYLANLFDGMGCKAYTTRELKKNGMLPPELDGCAGDGGIDLVVEVKGEDGNVEKIAVQAKYQKHKVTPDVINQLRGVTDLYQKSDMKYRYRRMVVTNNFYTEAAMSQASNDVELIDGNTLNKWIKG
jgi:HJR/Mrr/RecB family endonuclease